MSCRTNGAGAQIPESTHIHAGRPTKSRRYSTTFRRLRLARLAWRLAATDEPSIGRELQWSYVGSGFSRPIDAILASTVAEDRRRARGERWASLREEKAA